MPSSSHFALTKVGRVLNLPHHYPPFSTLSGMPPLSQNQAHWHCIFSNLAKVYVASPWQLRISQRHVATSMPTMSPTLIKRIQIIHAPFSGLPPIQPVVPLSCCTNLHPTYLTALHWDCSFSLEKDGMPVKCFAFHRHPIFFYIICSCSV